ncbi:GIY-YIG nuclease family protein [Balneola sp. EhC07]|uniref:GIY-YIG nuclease family protein n=1 Tax=Balneola sp. EhC07 TaxID=1849360 RepID=UPI001911A2E2|nr:GIY-YIG nuclease family protein [Balneola sp. EhC07]
MVKYIGSSRPPAGGSGFLQGIALETVLLTMNKGYVYFLTNYRRTTIYIGVTNNIHSRVWKHKLGEGSLCTSKYRLTIPNICGKIR